MTIFPSAAERRGSGSTFDVVVVGGGHAGCEAALAAARMGCSTLLLTLSLEKISLMPCNPAVGGVGKGQLTREIDALGGEQGRNTDRSFIQMKMLNTGKGPAVRTLRAQTDKKLYEDNMKRVLASETNLRVLEGEAAAVNVSRENITGITLSDGSTINSRSVVLACGTFLKANIVVGDQKFPAGRMGEPPSTELSSSLFNAGLALERFQSATPPRIDGRTIDFSKLTPDPGDSEPSTFSPFSRPDKRSQLPCYLTYTTDKTHDVVRKHLHLSPIKTGSINGKGPRYCPSIDRKIMNFPDRNRHPVFIEPEGRHTCEMYLQGLTTSLPVWVQEELIQATPGLENARIMRPGYAVEYDYLVPSQLRLTLETRLINRLFFAGQLNGTSGYEEAAAQGIVAGINASQAVKGEEPLVLRRNEAYIGVLIDDLVTKDVDEPYRMFTSHSEYRLLLRHDNAHARLSPLGHRLGLLPDHIYEAFMDQQASIDQLLRQLDTTLIHPDEIFNNFLESSGTSPISEPLAAAKLLKRPQISLPSLIPFMHSVLDDTYTADVLSRAQIEVKYHGYIARQLDDISRRRRLENTEIPEGFAFAGLEGIAIEAREKLARRRPATLGQASRIAGVSPADISILSVYLKKLS